MRCAPFTRALVLAIVGAAPALAFGGTITSGDVSFTISGFGTTPLADLTGVSANPATDHLFNSGWWYRVDAETRETPFPTPDLEDYSALGGQQAHLDWQPLDLDAKVSAHELINVLDFGAGGFVTRTMNLTNLTAQSASVALFHYVDLDVGGTATGDSARISEWTSRRILRIDDAGPDFGEFVAYNVSPGVPHHYCVAPYSAHLRDLLDDSRVDDCEDTGLPFPEGDFTAIHQFSVTLAPGQSRQVSVAIAVDFTWACGYTTGIHCDGFELGDPSVWSAAID